MNERPGQSRGSETCLEGISVADARRMALGAHRSFELLDDPKHLAFVLSRYKFAAEMGSRGKRILELGCSEGIGVPLLAGRSHGYLGIDMDGDAIRTATRNWKAGSIDFIEQDFLGQRYGSFDTVVSLDVVEHIAPACESLFFKTVYDNVDGDGVGIVGTPNITASQYSSATSEAGHVNLFSADRLRKAMLRLFHTVFLFALNDEVVHTGYYPMAHYLVAVGCYKREELSP